LHAELQQMSLPFPLSTQLLLLHCAPVVQVVPAACLPMQAPPMQYVPATQSSFDVQDP
jgi:hypothetical protein